MMSIHILLLLSYGILGASAGILAGLLGVGGGLIIVPILMLLFTQYAIAPTLSMHLAIGTSLATIIFTSLSSVWAHQRKGTIQWPVVRSLSVGILIGALLGACIAHKMSTAHLRLGFGLFELWVAIQMALHLQPKPHRTLPAAPLLALFGIGIGFISALVGIGGGTLTVPLLLWYQVTIHQAIATAAACGFPIALAGTIGFISVGWQHPALPPYSLGYVYLPALFSTSLMSIMTAPLGAHWAHQLNPVWLKRLFTGFLMLLAFKMLSG